VPGAAAPVEPAPGGPDHVLPLILVSLLDGYSRYVVHWELLTSMTAADVRLVAQHALEASGRKHVEIVTDNGSQFTSADFKALVGSSSRSTFGSARITRSRTVPSSGSIEAREKPWQRKTCGTFPGRAS
jgi:hypothetical protein